MYIKIENIYLNCKNILQCYCIYNQMQPWWEFWRDFFHEHDVFSVLRIDGYSGCYDSTEAH